MALPLFVVTLTFPLDPAPITAVMEVVLTTVKDVADIPPKLTADASVKFVPVMVMVFPVLAVVGVKADIVGGGKKLNPAKLVVPPASKMLTFPLAPLLLTSAVIVVALTIVKELAAMPPNLTAVVPVKFVPVSVMVVPPLAVTGVKEVMEAAGVTVSVMLLLIAVAVV